jgi:hypothetical protein
MKRLALIIIALIVAFVPMAHSADKILDAKITSMVERVDKNGNDYVRFIVDETRTLNGVEYSVGVPVMAFGSTVAAAKDYKAGDNLKCIVQGREYQGRQSYTILSFTQ